MAVVLVSHLKVFAVGMAVQSALQPVTWQLSSIAGHEKALLARIEGLTATAALETRVSVLETELKNLKQQQLQMAQQQPQQPQAPTPQAPPSEDMNKVYDLPVGASDVLGPKDAPITIVTFEDFQCPYCGKFYPAARDMVKEFPGKVKVVLKHFPLGFHNMAVPAAKASMAAGEQGKFHAMADLIFENSSSLSEEKFVELAGKAGLNVAKFTQDLKKNDAAYQKAIDADLDLGSKSDVRGTPTFFLNGKKTNARDVNQWKQEIQQLLNKK